jgi:hypothetical protein
MKVFISWSKDRSGIIADALRSLIQLVIQRANPWVSRSGIGAGSAWANTLREELSSTSFGIFCVNSENLRNEWLLFEAGAISKGLDQNRVCALLLDLEPGEITGPFAQFDNRRCDKAGVKSVLSAINTMMDDEAISEVIFEKAFESAWHEFEKEIERARTTKQESPTAKPKPDDMIAEILEIVKSSSGYKYASTQSVSYRFG